jgi:ATP-dependent DNA ligase
LSAGQKGEGTRKKLGSLLLACCPDGKLIYVGRVGTGMTMARDGLPAPKPSRSTNATRRSADGPLERREALGSSPSSWIEVTFLT